ncbi:MAG TPA: hypothetical protein EYO60_09495, partial [Candidatus Lambdaproteobacteria bacterium]|nr:hypothetical protein [Candidatus Lambdaproteobacteria bacterium]
MTQVPHPVIDLGHLQQQQVFDAFRAHVQGQAPQALPLPLMPSQPVQGGWGSRAATAEERTGYTQVIGGVKQEQFARPFVPEQKTSEAGTESFQGFENNPPLALMAPPGMADALKKVRSEYSDASEPSVDEINAFLDDPSDQMSQLPIQTYVVGKRQAGISDDVSALRLSKISNRKIRAAVLQTWIPSEQMRIKPPPGLPRLEHVKHIPYTKQPGREIELARTSYKLLEYRIEQINNSLSRRHDPDLVEELNDFRKKMNRLSKQHNFVPAITQIRNIRDPIQLEARLSDSRDVVNSMKLQAQNNSQTQDIVAQNISSNQKERGTHKSKLASLLKEQTATARKYDAI